jgi:hypothetical protein
LFGGLTALIFITIFRWLLLKWRVVDDTDETKKTEQTIIVATPEEFNEVTALMQQTGLKERIMGRVAPNEVKENSLGNIENLQTILKIITIREIIFCKGYLSYASIINTIQQLPKNVGVRFHAFGSHSIVGSDSKNTSGQFVSTDDTFQLNYAYQKRMKRLVDVGISFIILFTFPIHIFFIGLKSIRNAVMVLMGKKTWISYSQPKRWLPALPPGVLTTTGFPVKFSHPANRETANLIDHWYAKNYDWTQDVKIIIKNYKRLGGKS